MTQWMQQLFWHTLAMSAMVMAYYTATRWLRHRYAARWFYLAGAILLIGFLIPFRPVFTIEVEQAPAFLLNGAGQEAAAFPFAMDPSPAEQAAPGFPLWQTVFLVWALGALGTLAYQGIRHLRFIHAVKRWCTDVKDAGLLAQFDEAKRDLGLNGRDIGFAHCACISGPMLLRLDKPTILLPEKAEADDSSRSILLHELIHYQRRDLLLRLVMLFSTAIHWFNPAIYLLVKQVSLQCEISCDEKVVENKDIEGRHQYALSIIGVAQHQARGYTLLTTHFNGGKDTMKKRINSIYEPAKNKMGIVLLACVMVMTLLAGTSIAADTTEEPIKVTLPEGVVLTANEKVDSYVIKWEPIEGVKEYHIGAYYKAMHTDGNEYFAVADGWMGSGKVQDGKGKEYWVENAPWDAVTLKGDATEVDIAATLNKYIKPDNGVKTLLEYNVTILAVMESGEPITMTIPLPVK